LSETDYSATCPLFPVLQKVCTGANCSFNHVANLVAVSADKLVVIGKNH
jgi:hypothetical protein